MFEQLLLTDSTTGTPLLVVSTTQNTVPFGPIALTSALTSTVLDSTPLGGHATDVTVQSSSVTEPPTARLATVIFVAHGPPSTITTFVRFTDPVLNTITENVMSVVVPEVIDISRLPATPLAYFVQLMLARSTVAVALALAVTLVETIWPLLFVVVPVPVTVTMFIVLASRFVTNPKKAVEPTGHDGMLVRVPKIVSLITTFESISRSLQFRAEIS